MISSYLIINFLFTVLIITTLSNAFMLFILAIKTKNIELFNILFKIRNILSAIRYIMSIVIIIYLAILKMYDLALMAGVLMFMTSSIDVGMKILKDLINKN